MTTPENPQAHDRDPSGMDREYGEPTEKYLDITTELGNLQADFIDNLVAHAIENPQETTFAFSGLNYIDEKVGRDFSRLSWLSRGDELLVSGNVAIVLDSKSGQHYFMHMGDSVVLNGYAMSPRILRTPVREAIPDDIPPFEIVENTLEQWSLAIELSDSIVALPGDNPKVENLSRHFHVYLPLAYHDIQVERLVRESE